ECAKCVGESHTDRRLDLRLVYSIDFIFNRIFDCQNFASVIVNCTECGGKCRRFATASRTGYYNHAMRSLEGTAEHIKIARRESDRREGFDAFFTLQQPQNCGFAKSRWHRRNPDIGVMVADTNAASPVLWQSPFSDVQCGENFDA